VHFARWVPSTRARWRRSGAADAPGMNAAAAPGAGRSLVPGGPAKVGWEHVRTPNTRKDCLTSQEGAYFISGDEHATTYLLRNIPRDFSSWDLAVELDALIGLPFASAFDFVHVPVGKCCKGNMGYGFVNFIGGQSVRIALDCLAGKRWRGNGRPISAIPATCQGLRANLDRFAQEQQRRPDARKPLLFARGKLVDCEEAQVCRLRPEAEPSVAEPYFSAASAAGDGGCDDIQAAALTQAVGEGSAGARGRSGGALVDIIKCMGPPRPISVFP